MWILSSHLDWKEGFITQVCHRRAQTRCLWVTTCNYSASTNKKGRKNSRGTTI